MRSTQVAKIFLRERSAPENFITLVLTCIASHHRSDPDKSTEAILLHDGDALDFLGVVGVLRDFSKNPRDLRKAYEKTKQRREKLPETLVLSKSKEIVAQRTKQMDALLAAFETETFGYY